MWGAIIQAIDHAMERTQKGMSAGIDVANSQHGGAAGSATTSNEQIDTAKTGENIKSVANEAAKQKLNGSTKSGAPEGAAGADADAAEGIAGAAGSILSDQEAKESKSVSAKTAATNTVSGWKKARNYGTNLSKGFANAGAVATGQGKQYDIESPSIVDFDKDITKDFKAESSTNIKKSK